MKKCVILNVLQYVQVYKLLYATRLLDCGLACQAFHYCEVVGQAILRQRELFFVLTGEVLKVYLYEIYMEGLMQRCMHVSECPFFCSCQTG